MLKKEVNLKAKLKAGASVVRIRPLFTPDSKYLMIASGSDVKSYAIQSGECIHSLKYHKTQVISLQENTGNCLQIYSCSEDGVVVRWDYSVGKILQVYELHMCVVCFYVPNFSDTWFVTRKVKDQYRLYSFVPPREKFQICIYPVFPVENMVTFGCQGQYAAAIYENSLTIIKLDGKKRIKHLATETFTCISCHPNELVFATGDIMGRIIVWSNVFDKRNVIRTLYHWHSLPVADIAFSSEGSYLYSGGGEACLVKWNLFKEMKSLLPRLGAPIHRLNISRNGSFVLTAHNDNSLQIINSQENIVQIIQGLTQSHFQGARTNNFISTGLLYDARNKALVLNGKPGHLQFYSIHEDKHLFNLDVVGRNFVSQDRVSVILNTDVQKAAIDDKGFWLSTVEYWSDEETSPQIWLKFWEFDTSKQTYILNTNVFLPHSKEVNCILFRPLGNLPLAVTTSNDCHFKIWTLKDDVSFDGKQSWTCESMGCYRDMPAGDACFSEEGSLLAVAFANVATLWNVDKTSLKAVICNGKNNNKINQLAFGRKSCSHFLMCQDGISITAWNLLSLSIEWIVQTSVQLITCDLTSDIVAAFCDDQSLLLFRPDNPKPIYSLESVSKKPIIGAIFFPLEEETSSFLKTSNLLFFDADQNLLTLTDENDEVDSNKINKITVAQSLPLTPFAMLQAESKISNVEAVEYKLLPNTPSDTKSNVETISYSAFMMDPMTLCTKLLESLLIPSEKRKTNLEQA
ncbi:WD repeat-containing protein 75 [Trichonephila inaurata madagascariensis]|uniref:WD repeat-containing protein 75 n=1 Tax=Trichonephila inaurata madagascariensis TaxID=2747483 RepID=A0A8X6YCZ0_9ARAC|nr:WD repeat-containing protein 75 [Trichonephila inaurata madagascariensis]